MAKKIKKPVIREEMVSKSPETDPVKSGGKMTPQEWMKKINRSKQYRTKEAERQGWKQNLECYEGDYKINNTQINVPPINIVFGYVDTLIARMYARDPYISANAGKGNSIERAHLVEKILNYIKKEINLKGEVEKIIRDATLCSMGWIKYGFTGEIGEESVTPQENNPGEAAIENVSEFVRDGEVFAMHVPWEDILFDVPLCKDPPYDCRWIAHRIIKPVSAWKESRMYKNTADIKPNVSMVDLEGKKIDDALKDSEDDLFEAWEIHDKDSNRIFVVAEGLDKYLRDEENVKEMKGLPFSALKFNPNPKKPYPLADVFIIKPQVFERIKLRGAQLNHIKRWSRQLSIEKGSMAPEEISKFEQGQDGAVTQREKGSAPPQPIQYAPLQDEIFVLDDMIQRDMDLEIGQTDVDRGGQARTKTNTKYELQEQQQGTSSRVGKRIDKLEDFLGEVFTKILALMKQFQSTEKYVAITGLTAAEVTEKMGLGPEQTDGQGIMFTKEDIQGEYDIEVKAGSTLPMNKENEIQLVENLLQMLPAIGMVPGNPLQIALLGELLRKLDLQEAVKAWDEMKNQSAGPQGPGGSPGVPPLAPSDVPQGQVSLPAPGPLRH